MEKVVFVWIVYLDHLGVKALAHFSSSMSQQYRAISVDVNQSTSLEMTCILKQISALEDS